MNRLSLLNLSVGGLSSINFVKSASVDSTVDSIFTTGNSGNSGSCGVNEGFLKKKPKFLKMLFLMEDFQYCARISFINSCRDRFSNARQDSSGFGTNVGRTNCSAEIFISIQKFRRNMFNLQRLSCCIFRSVSNIAVFVGFRTFA